MNEASKDPPLRCLIGQWWWYRGKHMEKETDDQDTLGVIKSALKPIVTGGFCL